MHGSNTRLAIGRIRGWQGQRPLARQRVHGVRGARVQQPDAHTTKRGRLSQESGLEKGREAQRPPTRDAKGIRRRAKRQRRDGWRLRRDRGSAADARKRRISKHSSELKMRPLLPAQPKRDEATVGGDAHG